MRALGVDVNLGWDSLATLPFRMGPSDTSLTDFFGEATVARLRSKFAKASDLELHDTLRELARYFYLCAQGPESLFFSGNKLMDDLWHALIIETRSYRELCERLKPGCFIDHSGVTFEDYLVESSPEKIHEEQCSWLTSYVANFGEIDEAAFDCLLLPKALCDRMRIDRPQLNQLAMTLMKIADVPQSDSEPFDFPKFVEKNVRPVAHQIDFDPNLLGSTLKMLIEGVRRRDRQQEVVLTNEELELLFGASTALSFTLWQHLAVVERLSGLSNWQADNADLWSAIASGRLLCGLATTHLAKPGGAGVGGIRTDQGYLVSGVAPWVCGHRIFDKLLIGFDNETEIVFAIIDYPNPSAPRAMECTEVTSLDLACLRGTATVSIQFNQFPVLPSGIVSKREKGTPPVAVRPPRYILPELGIAKATIKEIEETVTGSPHPRHQLVVTALADLRTRLGAIEAQRTGGLALDELIPLRDELNRDVIRVLALAGGADALKVGSTVTRLQLETLLLDVVVQSPRVLERKIKSTGRGVHALA